MALSEPVAQGYGCSTFCVGAAANDDTVCVGALILIIHSSRWVNLQVVAFSERKHECIAIALEI